MPSGVVQTRGERDPCGRDAALKGTVEKLGIRVNGGRPVSRSKAPIEALQRRGRVAAREDELVDSCSPQPRFVVLATASKAQPPDPRLLDRRGEVLAPGGVGGVVAAEASKKCA